MRSIAPALLPIFRSPHQAALLSRLFLPTDEVAMTELARDLGIPLTTLHREVERLEEAGLLSSRRVGRTRLIRADRRHPAARALSELLTTTFGPAQVVAEEFTGLDADAVIIFGSWARRHAGETGPFPGDIDVLVVGDGIDTTAADRCADAAQRRLGVAVSPVVRTIAAWAAAPPDPLVAGIRTQPHLQVLPKRTGFDPASPKTPTPSPPECVYRLRPTWRPRYQPDVTVPASLHMLTGPTSGRHDPPVNLYWQPGELDFAERGDVELFYSSALTAATTAEQFRRWIDGPTLAAVWSRLSLPARVRAAWETIHPELRNRETTVNDRIRIQDVVLAAIAEYGFALAGGSALIDYDVVSRDTEDIDAFNDRWDATAFQAALHSILQVCAEQGWHTQTMRDEDMDKQVLVDAATGSPVVVQMVYYERSRDPEHRASGGLRLIFDDVVGGKGAAIADVARGRDFFDLANIVATPGWTLARVEDAMRAIKFGDQVESFRANLDRFRRGDFDDDIHKSGFDPAFCHRILD
ncbi:winged helix-turn-helix transcriptional regulator [Mycobacterium sp. M1]|uniref:Winged helix-turn-helix transcriptional regulator n=1 Tax=Mycolicibacter acidiphilus TaxID=2835306 RepID=A0ABS5RI84_9MYCO|nr:winged helix-turn-helix domain-containing protein [Mycolicibacter acidiphilus]MBS9533273.1 winged helix-turn-helix transcriptional regulator [Mycolicibacter acidiphilus]